MLSLQGHAPGTYVFHWDIFPTVVKPSHPLSLGHSHNRCKPQDFLPLWYYGIVVHNIMALK